MAFESTQFLSGFQVPNFEGGVPRGRDNLLAVRCNSYRTNSFGMPLESPKGFARFQVPYLEGRVLGARDGSFSIPGNGQGPNSIFMTVQSSQKRPTGWFQGRRHRSQPWDFFPLSNLVEQGMYFREIIGQQAAR